MSTKIKNHVNFGIAVIILVVLLLVPALWAAPLSKTYKAKLVGTFNDWESISGNKVTDVKIASDTNFIYLWSDTLLQQVHIGIWLGGSIIQSDTLFAPEYDSTRIVAIFSTTKPGGGDWTVGAADSVQGHVSDTHNNFEQSFKFFSILVPFNETWDIVSVGIRATIQFGSDLDQIQLRVLYIEKEVLYFVE